VSERYILGNTNLADNLTPNHPCAKANVRQLQDGQVQLWGNLRGQIDWLPCARNSAELQACGQDWQNWQNWRVEQATGSFILGGTSDPNGFLPGAQERMSRST
jgi:hypothetical protein